MSTLSFRRMQESDLMQRLGPLQRAVYATILAMDTLPAQ